MEKFAIDLDKVLDDFEESEGRAVQLDSTTIKDGPLMKNSFSHMPSVDLDNKLFYISHNVCESQTHSGSLEKLDLSEEDFTSTLKPSLLPICHHYNTNISCDDVQTHPFQTLHGKSSVDVNNENISEAWTSNLNEKSHPDIYTNADISTEHLANGYHVQNDEILCISLQNKSQEENDSSSSDIQIKLLSSFSESSVPKVERTKSDNSDELVLSQPESSVFHASYERQDIKILGDSNNQVCDVRKDETSFEHSERIQPEERASVNENDLLEKGTFGSSVFKISPDEMAPDGTEEIRCYQDCVSESFDYILKTDKLYSLNKDGFCKDIPVLNAHSDNVHDELRSLQESSDKCTENQSDCSSSYNAFNDSAQDEAPVGFSHVESDDHEADDMDDYLQDVSHATSEILSANSEVLKESQTVDQNESSMKSHEKDNDNDCSVAPSSIVAENLNNQKVIETSFDNTGEHLIEKGLLLSDPNEISSQIEDLVENKITSKKDILSNWADQQEAQTDPIIITGMQSKLVDFNANDNFDETVELEKELSLLDKVNINDSEFSAKKEKFSYSEQLCEEVIFQEKSNENDSVGCQDEEFTQQNVECPKIYDKNGNITDHSENENPAIGLTSNSCFVEQGGFAQTARHPRPTTLNLPVRVSVRPQASDFENLSTVELSENLNELDGEANTINQAPENLNQEQGNEEHQVGKVKPFWFPDACTSSCMHCDSKFTVLKRRHHCRACGKVLCSNCCNQKTRLPYMDNKEARVCQHCFAILVRVQEQERLFNNNMPPSPSSGGSSPSLTPSVQSGSNSPGVVSNQQGNLGWWPPNPNNPQEYCSTISPLQQVQPYLNCPPPTVLVPIGEI